MASSAVASVAPSVPASRQLGETYRRRKDRPGLLALRQQRRRLELVHLAIGEGNGGELMIVGEGAILRNQAHCNWRTDCNKMQ